MKLKVLLVYLVCVSSIVSGCKQDYSPARPYADTASTLPVEEEDMLIDNGEVLLEQLELDKVADISQAAKSFQDLNADKKAVEDANKFTADELPSGRWVDADKLPINKWEVYYLRSQPLGYLQQTFRKSAAVGGEDRMIIESKSAIQQSRNNETLQTESEFLIVESLNGGLKSVNGKITQGETVNSVDVVVASNEVRITTTKNGSRAVRTIVRDEKLRGPFAVEESLLGKTMEVGESRKLLVFEPSLSDVVQVELIAKGVAKVPVSTGEFLDLLEVEQRIDHGTNSLMTTLWVDPQGVVQKRYLGLRGLTSHNVAKDVAMAVRDASALQRYTKRSIALQRSLQVGEEQTSVVFRASSIDADPYKIFKGNNWQLVQSLSPLTCDIEIRPLKVGDLLARAPQPSVMDEEYLGSTRYIDHTDNTIVELRKAWLQENADLPEPLRLAIGVRKLVQVGEFSYNVYPASQVALRKETDSMGVACLLCAALRSAGYPASVAAGLTYNGDVTSPAMKFHAWAEVYYNGQWLPIDATQDDSTLPMASIKVAESAMADQNPLQGVVPVFEAIQKVGLTVR